MELKKVVNPANQVMKDRHSVRKYDTSVKISREEMKNILQDASTAPSSLNLQPWRFVVIDTEEAKAGILPYVMFNQQQVETASAIIAVFGDYENFSYTDRIYSAAVEHKLIPQETKDKMLEMITNYRQQSTEEYVKDVFMFDCGLISMQVMLAAKAYGYDTNPIGGYMKKELTETLGLDTGRYYPVILISIGKSAEEEHDSIRFSVDEITQWK